MKLIHLNLILTLSFLHLGCDQAIRPIQYAEEDCHFCQMRIMDPRFGSEAITDKGRIYTFDSAECLFRYLNDTEAAHTHLLVTDYAGPRQLIDARAATFVISEHIPSPMGGNLSAFISVDEASQSLGEREGMVLTWEQVKHTYEK